MSKERSYGVIRNRFALSGMAFLLVCHSALALSAQGAVLKPADGLENWKESIDLGAYAPGKYNLVVEGKDKAGNVTRAAPMNVFVDPKSDLPIVSVINPTELMRVGGDLNIVGTAVDDDGIDHVELKLDGGEWQSAEGKEFWSFYLKTDDIPEGRRSLEVRAVDLNGLAGQPVRVRFDLDRTKPLPAMDAPTAGSLVSGQIRLVGTVYDANGMKSLEISQDGGKKWSPVPIKTGWASLKSSFSWSVDTKKLGDGPKVFMLRSADMVGSKSIAAYLLFVDNTRPTIELALPAAGKAVHGRFAIAGAVRDAVGVKSLSYELGAEKGEIPLTRGDPFFVKEFDASAVKGDSVQLALIAEDRIGNVTRLAKSLKIDRAADKPVLKVLGPAPESGAAEAKSGKGAGPSLRLRPGETVWGSIRDDDGAAAFRWSLDGGAPAEVPCSSVFSLGLPEASSGRHSLVLTPVDVNGTPGDPVQVQLFVDKGPGRVSFDRLTSSKGSRDFSQGIEAAVDSGEYLDLSIESPNALASAEYSIAGGKRLALAKAEAKGANGAAASGGGAAASRFRILLDRSLPYGFAPIEVFAKDVAGNEFGGKALVYVTNYGIAREEPGFRFSDPRVGANGEVIFGKGAAGAPRPLLGAFYGGELSSLRFDPPTDLVAASFDGRTVSLTPAKEGRSAPTRLYGKTTKGREFSAGPLVFETDATPPVLAIDSPAEGTWFGGKLAVGGKASDGVGVARLSWRILPGGEAKAIEPKKDGSFSFELSAADLQPGPFSIEVEASDAAGNVARAYRSLGADAAGPKLSFLAPEKGAVVAGPETVVAMLQSASGIASVEYAADGKSFESIERSGLYFAHRADLAANPNAAYRVKDAAGNVVTARPEVAIAASRGGGASGAAPDETQAPLVAVLYPEAGAQALPGPFPIVLKVEGSSASSVVELTVGGAKPFALPGLGEGGEYFATMVDPRAAPKGSALALGIASRAGLPAPGSKNGAKAETRLALKYGYDAASDAPALALDSLVAEPGGLVCGRASDDDGPAALGASLDGGETLSFPAGAFAFALPPLAPGKHLLALEATGPFGERTTVKKEFAVKAGAPALGDFRIGDGKSFSPWSPGADFALGPSSAFAGSLSGGSGAATVSLSFNGGAPVQAAIGKAPSGAAAGSASFSAPMPASLPYGRVSIELRAKDSSGQESVEVLELHKILPPSAGSDDAESLRFSDSRIVELEGKSSILLRPGESLVGRFNGRPIVSVGIVPAASSLAASFDGSSVTISAKDEGLAASAKLELKTVDGESFEWGPFSAAVDAEAPRLAISAPADNDWVSSSVHVAGLASDRQGIVSLRLSVNGGEAMDLASPEALKAKGELGFDKTIPLAELADGPARLDFVARDGAGRESRVSRYVNKDATPPVLSQVIPGPSESVNGLTTFIAEAVDEGALATVAFAAAGGEKAEELAVHGGVFSRDLDLARLTLPLPEGAGFVATDKAGNKALLAPELAVDKEKDKPVVEIDTPSELEVLRGDFAIAGSAYDDDGLAAAYYRIDGGEWSKLAMDGSSFSIPIALKDTGDNEHLVEVKAEDIYGVQGDVVSRKYRISKEEPRALLIAPPIDKPVRGKVMLSGGASDANGIKEVSVSVDNRASFGRPVGTESWSLELDTTALSDGIHAVAVRPVDGYDTEGFYASMISVDNTPPKAQLDLPRDGEEVSGKLEVSGRVSDNIAVASARIEVSPVGSAAPPALVVDLGADKIAQRAVDLSGLKPGVYTVRLVAVDRADNESLASRDIKVLGGAPLDSVSILFPAEGDSASGKLRVQGRAVMASGAQSIAVLADGAEIGSAEPDELGWFSFEVPAGALVDGERMLKARAVSKEGRTVESPDTRVEWKALGPWVSIDSFASGKYLPYRPFLSGKAGWLSEEAPSGKEELAAYRKSLESRRVMRIEVSLDDGMTYAEARGAANWSFRLETQDFKEGALHAIVRARYADGSSACAKGLYYLDKTPPQVELLAPTEGGRFNGALAVSGRAWDENGLRSVGVALRKGDKASYEVPSFIQGLYFDGQMLGATDWQAGMGLSFFDDNVKLEAIYGQAPDYDSSGSHESFYGDVVGGKLIANVLYLPYSSLFGPDWSFLSTSLGLGANFSYFTKTQAGSGLFVGSIFAQLEFPKITFSRMSVFKKISTYAEFQLWVLSSVVDGGFIPKLSFGARVGVF